MRQKFANTLHFLATFSFYFFLVFIPLTGVLLFIISFIGQQVYECPYQVCFAGYIVLVVGLILGTILTGLVAWAYGSPFGRGDEGRRKTEESSTP